MASGTVKWWDRRKGYGFIFGETGRDVFVHYTTIQGGGYKSLEPGEPVLKFGQRRRTPCRRLMESFLCHADLLTDHEPS